MAHHVEFFDPFLAAASAEFQELVHRVNAVAFPETPRKWVPGWRSCGVEATS